MEEKSGGFKPTLMFITENDYNIIKKCLIDRKNVKRKDKIRLVSITRL